MYTILLPILSLISINRFRGPFRRGAGAGEGERQVRREGPGCFYWSTVFESSLSNLHPTDKGHPLSGESNTVFNTLCANVPKQGA